MKTATVNEIRLLVTVEVEQAIKEMKRYETSLAKSKTKISDFAKNVNKFGSQITKFASLPLANAGVYAIKAAADFEKVKTSYGVLLQSVEKGNKLFDDLKKFSASTPLQMDDINQAAQGLLEIGFSANELTGVLRKIGDAAMGDADKFKRLAAVIGKVKSQGKAELEQVNSIAEMGIPIIDELRKQYGFLDGEQSKVFDKISRGKLSFKDLNQAITSLTTSGGKYAGMMEQISQTTAAKWSIAVDNFKGAAAELGEVALPIVNELLDHATILLKGFSELDDGEKKLIMIGGALLALVGPAAKVTAGIANIAGAVGKLTGKSKDLSKLGGVLGKIAPMLLSPAGLATIAGIGLVGAVGYMGYKNSDGYQHKQTVKGLDSQGYHHSKELDFKKVAILQNSKSFEEAKKTLKGLTSELYSFAKSTKKYQEVIDNLAKITELENKIKKEKAAATKIQNEEFESLFRLKKALRASDSSTLMDMYGVSHTYDSANSNKKRVERIKKDYNQNEALFSAWESKYGLNIKEVFSQLEGNDWKKFNDEKLGQIILEIQKKFQALEEAISSTASAISEEEEMLQKLKSGSGLKSAYKSDQQKNKAPDFNPLFTVYYDSTLDAFQKANDFLSETLNLSNDYHELVIKDVAIQQQINGLIDQKNKIFNKNKSKEATDETRAIDNQINALIKQAESLNQAKKLRDNLASLSEKETITIKDILASESSILKVGKKLSTKKEAEKQLIKDRKIFFQNIDTAIEQLNGQLKDLPEIDPSEIEKLENKIKYLESISDLNPDKKPKAKIDTEKLGYASVVENFINDMYAGISQAVNAESHAEKRDAGVGIAKSLLNTTAGALETAFPAYAPLISAIQGVANLLIDVFTDAFDFENAFKEKIKDANKPITELAEKTLDKEKELNTLRNQHIDSVLQKQKEAHQQEMEMLNARHSAEVRNLEEMRKAGVISASEYEDQMVALAQKHASEAGEKTNQHQAKIEKIEKFKNYAQDVEDAVKKAIENNKANYKDQFKTSYEEGLMNAGSGNIWGKYGKRKEKADEYEHYIQEIEEFLKKVQAGEFETQEALEAEQERLFKRHEIFAAAKGADFTTNKPTLMLVGEAGQEHVQVTPAPIRNSNKKENITIVVNNPIGLEGYTKQMIEAARVLNKRGRI